MVGGGSVCDELGGVSNVDEVMLTSHPELDHCAPLPSPRIFQDPSFQELGERTETRIRTPTDDGDNAVVIVGLREGITQAVALIKEMVTKVREQVLCNEANEPHIEGRNTITHGHVHNL